MHNERLLLGWHAQAAVPGYGEDLSLVQGGEWQNCDGYGELPIIGIMWSQG